MKTKKLITVRENKEFGAVILIERIEIIERKIAKYLTRPVNTPKLQK